MTCNHVAPKTLHQDPQYKPKWENRRNVIKICLWSCLILYTIIILSGCFSLLLVYIKDKSNITFDANVVSLLQTGLWSLSGIAISVIGSYVFGAQWDINNYRKNAGQLIDKISIPTEGEH